MFCLKCRYPLKGLNENRCPECGSAFDPDDARTHGIELKYTRERAQQDIKFVVSISILVVCLLIFPFAIIFIAILIVHGLLRG